MGFGLVQFSEYDKVVHYVTFLVLTGEFYYMFDVSTHSLLRMLRYVTMFTCTFSASVFLEVVQGVLNPSRVFDYYDIVYNVAGSFTGLILATLFDMYRFRKRRNNRVRIVEIELEEGITNPPSPETYNDYVNVKINDATPVK